MRIRSDFMQDIHTARMKKWLENKSIKLIKWFSYSSDLNSTEHCWTCMKKWIYKHHSELLNLSKNENEIKKALSDALEKAWETINKDYSDALLNSMSDICETVDKVKNWYIK